MSGQCSIEAWGGDRGGTTCSKGPPAGIKPTEPLCAPTDCVNQSFKIIHRWMINISSHFPVLIFLFPFVQIIQMILCKHHLTIANPLSLDKALIQQICFMDLIYSYYLFIPFMLLCFSWFRSDSDEIPLSKQHAVFITNKLILKKQHHLRVYSSLRDEMMLKALCALWFI